VPRWGCLDSGMGFKLFWRDLARQIEFSFSQAWDYLKVEVPQHSYIVIIIALIPFILGRFLKGSQK
jgi:hypothetical protein